MENHSNTTTFESEHPTAELSPREIRDLFNEQSILDIRAKQHEAYKEEYERNISDKLGTKTSDLFANYAAESVMDDYIIDSGLEFTDPRFATYRDALMKSSITFVEDKDWKVNSHVDKDGNKLPSGREQLQGAYENLTGLGYYERIRDEHTPVDQPEDVEETTTQPETAATTIIEADPYIESQKARLNTLRDKVAELSAERQGRLFGSGGKEYDENLQAYNNLVIVLGKLTHKELIEDQTIDETEKNKQIIEYLFEEQNKLRQESLKKLENTTIHKFISGFAKIMDSEKRSVRIAKSVALGVGVGALVGATAGMGAGFVIAAGAGGVGLRLARSFAQREAKAGRGIDALEDGKKDELSKPEQSDNLYAEQDDTPLSGFEALSARFNSEFEKDTRTEQNKRKRSVAIAVGTVAIGAFIGHHAASFLGDVVDQFTSDAPKVELTPLPEPTDVYGPEVPDPEIGSADGANGGIDGGGYTPEAPIEPEFVPDARFDVPDGKGGIWLFQNAGLTEADWYSVQGELAQNFPDDFYTEGGDVRIAHDGQLSQAAQEFIKSRFYMA